jgi:hypothetical protein
MTGHKFWSWCRKPDVPTRVSKKQGQVKYLLYLPLNLSYAWAILVQLPCQNLAVRWNGM